MIVVTVLYPKSEGARFDFDYYVAKHLPLVAEKLGPLGLQGARAMRGAATMDGSSPAFEVIAELEFLSVEALRDAMAARGAEVIGDLPNFTDMQPTIQINELL